MKYQSPYILLPRIEDVPYLAQPLSADEKAVAKKEAERLIVIANFNKIIEQIPKKETRERILKEINKQL